MKLCRELEALYCSDSLDVEFAVNQKGELYLFQVRPLILKATDEISLENTKSFSDNKKQSCFIIKTRPTLLGKNNFRCNA